MQYAITHVIEGNLLRIALSGPFENNRFEPILQQVWEWAQTPGVELLLIDIRELEGRVSLSQIFFNIRSYPLAAAALKTAVLERAENMERAAFHDTAAGNMGFHVRHFSEEPTALAWLRAA